MAKLVNALDLSPSTERFVGSTPTTPTMKKTIKKTYGPYERPDGRKHVIHVYTDGSRRTQSYPRFLVEQATGEELSMGDDIHHIDGNHTNNALSNLEVISMEDHKSNPHSREAEYYYFDCPVCGESTSKPMRNVRGNWKKGRPGPFCSRSCAGKYSSLSEHIKKRIIIDGEA